MRRSVAMVTLSIAALVLSGTALAASPYTIKVPKYSHTTIRVSKISRPIRVSKISHPIKVSKISHPIKFAKPSKRRLLVPSRAGR